jgi:outer membrane protein OmpA-like peptidoglycan-associated protein
MKFLSVIWFAILLSLAVTAQQADMTTSQDQSTSIQSSSTSQDQTTTNPDQTMSPSSQSSDVEPMAQTPVYRVTVVGRTTKAVNYRHRGGSTKVDFRGTELMPQASGSAHVDSKSGRLEINAEFDHVQPARNFGPEYLTYVLWAITPEGRPKSLGEVLLDNGKAKLHVTSDLQAFGMIITAEPYFAVTQPSNLVVLENIIRTDTKGWEQPIETKFEALDRGQYTVNIPAAQLPATNASPKVPLDLLEARNAVAIAKATGADRYAPDSLKKAEDFLARAEDYLTRKQGRTPIGTVARGATESAEDARVLTIRRREQERVDTERRAMQEREAQAKAEAQASAERAQQESQQRQQAEQDRQAAEQAKTEAERSRKEAEQANQQAQLQRQQAEEARQAALAQQQSAQAETQKAQLAAQQAQQEKEQMRARLLQQLNQVLQTRDSARGLIVNMPDVLFDFGKYTLRSAARERLAKVAGIILAYPDLHLQVEGNTDNVGSDAYNQRLSEQRAATVRDYLVSQGVSIAAVNALGFGKTRPVASNATPSGRQLNRRVDMVVSGEAIGTKLGSNPAENGMSSPGGSSSGAAAGGQSTSMPGQAGTAPPSQVRSPTGTQPGAPSGTSPAAPGNPPPNNNPPQQPPQ